MDLPLGLLAPVRPRWGETKHSSTPALQLLAAPELLDVPWRALWKVPAGTFVAAADTLVVIALVARCCARASPARAA